VCEELYNYLREDQVVYVDGDTPDREEIFEKIRAGEYKAVVSIGTLTTGFDAPIVDCIVMLRATKSTSLFVQICGRGLRPYQGKENLLILDFAQNFTRFGTLENPMVTNMGLKQKSDSSEGSEQKKNCDSCAAEISFFARECGFCGEIFKLNHSRSAHRQGDKAQLHRMKVMSVFVEPHIKKDTSERGFKVTWRVLKDGKLRQLFEFFMVHRSPAIKLAYERRRAQMNADPLFVIASIDGIFIKPIEVETTKVVL
jgi:DNA repair protein RadD